MTTPSTNLNISHLAEEFTPVGVGIRAKARCLAPDDFSGLSASFNYGGEMAISNSPVWTGNGSEDWCAVLLDSVIITPNPNFADQEGAHYVQAGMIVDYRDEIFGGKKVVSAIDALHPDGSLAVKIVILRPALTSAQIQKAQAYNRSTGYWMNFWAGSLGQYTKGHSSDSSYNTSLGATLRGTAIRNAGIVPDLPGNAFAPDTPSIHSTSPGTISMGDYRNKGSAYTASYSMPTTSGSWVEDFFGALPTGSKQTRLSTVYKEFTIPDTTGVDYEVTVGEFMYGLGGRWRSYTHGSYLYYGGGTEYWYSFWENCGWAVYDVTDGNSVFHAVYVGTNSFSTTGDSTVGGKVTGTAQTFSVTPGRTYRMYYRATYYQTSGMGDEAQDMLFISTNNTWSIVRTTDGVTVATDTGTKPSITVNAKLGDKWKNVSTSYHVPSARGIYDPTQKGF